MSIVVVMIYTLHILYIVFPSQWVQGIQRPYTNTNAGYVIMQQSEKELTSQQEYTILQKHVANWSAGPHAPNRQIKVYHCLEMSHPLADGRQRVRCYPFPNHKFHTANHMDAVFIIPQSRTPANFQLPRDRRLLDYAKVLLFFQIKIRGRIGRLETVDCAFIKYYEKYTVQGL
jgi:hypothetical protein